MMERPSTSRSRIAGALALAVLAALAAVPRAAAASTRAAEDLNRGAARADDFKRVLDGSADRRGDVDAPTAFEEHLPLPPIASARLSRPEAALRPDGALVPSAPATLSPRQAAPARRAWVPDLQTRGIAAALGLGLLLIAASWLETPRELETEGGTAPAAPIPAPERAPTPLRARERALDPDRFAESLAERDYIDTRMPVSTWRAISLREQSVIDAWDASPEKSAGRASLAEWLDARGAAAGVDVPLLKAKLFRDA